MNVVTVVAGNNIIYNGFQYKNNRIVVLGNTFVIVMHRCVWQSLLVYVFNEYIKGDLFGMI